MSCTQTIDDSVQAQSTKEPVSQADIHVTHAIANPHFHALGTSCALSAVALGEEEVACSEPTSMHARESRYVQAG